MSALVVLGVVAGALFLNDLSVAHDRRGPADNAAEAFADRVFGAGVGSLFRGKGQSDLFQALGDVGADQVGADIGADDLGNVDFTGLEAFQFGKVVFGANKSVTTVADVLQCLVGQVALSDLDLFVAGQVDVSHFDEQRRDFGFAQIFRWAQVEVAGIVRQDGARPFGFKADGFDRLPGFGVGRQPPGAVPVEGTLALR